MFLVIKEFANGDAIPSPLSAKARSDAKLAEILLAQNVISQSELDRARQEGERSGNSLRNALSGLDICLEDEINWTISRALGIPFVLLANEMVDSETISLFSLDLLRDIVAIPILDASGGVTLVMADPLDEPGFERIQEQYGEELHLAVAPSGRVAAVLDYLEGTATPPSGKLLELEAKDTSGVAAVYGMIIDARSRGVNRILIRPAGDGLEAIFRLERGWLPYGLWGSRQGLSIITRCRIMMGLLPVSQSARESSKITSRINRERVLIEAEFIRDATGCNIDFRIYPVITSPTLQEFETLTEHHRVALLKLFSARRPTGIVIVNAPDQRLRYRMVYSLLSMLGRRNLDMISVEERKYLESPSVRRFQVKSESPEWDEVAQQPCEVMAVIDAPFWKWRQLSAEAGQKFLILGLDLANSWLAFSSFNEMIENRAVVSDRVRAIWTGKRADLTCKTCHGRIGADRRIDAEGKCPECDGYGHSGGTDLFEVIVFESSFQRILISDRKLTDLKQEFDHLIVQPSISDQLASGIEKGVIFNAVDYYE